MKPNPTSIFRRLSNRWISPVSGLVTATVLFSSVLSQGANLTWDSDTATTGVQEGPGTWTSATTNFWNGTTLANGTPVKGTDQLFFGATPNTADAPHVVTISNGGALLNYADSQGSSTITFNRNYTIAGAAAGDGLAVGNLTVAGGATVSISAQLTGGAYTGNGTTGAVGTRNWSVNDGSTLNLSGGGRLQNLLTNSLTLATVNISGGQWTTGGFNDAGVAQNFPVIGGGNNTNLVVNQTGGDIAATGGNFNIGTASAPTVNTTRTVYNISGGSLTAGNISTGAGSNNAGSTGSQSRATLNISGTANVTAGELRAGNDGGSGFINVSGGTVNSGTLVISRIANTVGAVTSEANFSGGVSTIGGITLGNPTLPNNQSYFAGSSAALNVSGGTLYVGGAGINANPSANLTKTINFSGGVVGASANWSTAQAITLSNANGGVTLKAADASNVARNITLTGALSGSGPLTKTGLGAVTLNSTTTLSSYSGGTFINQGSLVANATAALGTGNVTVADVTGALLDLNIINAISQTATLYFGDASTINLDYAGTQILAGVIQSDDVNQTLTAGGAYTASQLNSFFGVTSFTGTGLIQVAIPEPTTTALLGLGLVSLCVVRKRRNG